MISLHSAINIIQKKVKPLSAAFIETIRSEGVILAEDIKSDLFMPSFNRSLMDGFAIKSKNYKKNKWYNLLGEIKAGEKRGKSLFFQKIGTAPIMTGALVSPFFDAVIPVENSIEDQKRRVKFSLSHVSPFLNVAPMGSDCRENTLLLSKGDKIKTSSLLSLFSAGKKTVRVYKKPVVNLIVTGDELVDIDKKPAGTYIRNLNSYIIKALCLKFNVHLKKESILKDNKALINKKIKEYNKDCDLLIITGGVSMGKYDYVHEILKKNYDILFHKVAEKPGKPVLLARNVKHNNYILGLPGNPVSVLISFYSIGLPVIRKLSGFNKINHDFYKGVLKKKYKKDKDRLHFVPAKIKFSNMSFNVYPVPFHTSGDVISLINTDGFFIAEKQKNYYKKGDEVKFLFFHS